VLRPYAAYLRVYEPLEAFGDPTDPQLLAAVRSSRLTRSSAGDRERALWFASQMSAPPKLLPGSERAKKFSDVLVLSPDDVPAGRGVQVGPGPLVCPLELRARSAAALVTFLSEAHPVVRTHVLQASGFDMETARARATSVLREVRQTALHVLSATWSIPLPWFTMVDPTHRKLVLGEGQHDPKREVSWRVAMADARKRVAEARELAESVIGDDGPTRVLIDTDRWLANFHPNSAVELDYGGLVQLIPDEELAADTTAEKVHAVLAALHDGDVEKLAELFAGLQDYWGELAARERFN
jgi:hypothetical protein